MNPTPPKKKITIQILFCFLLILCFFYVCSKVWATSNNLASRNASDTLMLLVELATESGDNYIKAKEDFAEMLLSYSNHMKQRELHWLLKIPLLLRKNAAKELERVRKVLISTAKINDCNSINEARDSIYEFLTKSKLFTDEPTTTFGPEVISGEIQKVIIDSLNEANSNSEDFANNKSRTEEDAKKVCLSNRKAIVYLYLARFNYQEFIDEETVKEFRTNINRTIYYNRLLQETEPIKARKDVEDSFYKLLDKYTSSELRRLGLLQAIIDNDIQQSQDLLQTVLINAGILL